MDETAISPAFVNAPSRRRVSVESVAGCLFLLALWFVLCRHLSAEWSVNEQYSYGWFVPFFAVYLFWLRWEDRPAAGTGPAERPTSNPEKLSGQAVQRPTSNWSGFAIGIAIIALLMLLPIRLFEVGNPDWRPLAWAHTLAVATLTCTFIWSVGGSAWLRHFAFPIGFFFVAVPWISPIEGPIIQGLMRVVAVVSTEVVNLCGIPAQVEGNLIRVSTGLVGVNEACSGVRSLQTSIMIGLLFGELKRLSVGRRITLVLCALAVALLGNFGRAFFLVWIAATRQTEAVSSWHDIAGYSIVALVFVTTIALAAKLARNGYQLSVNGYRETENKEQITNNPQDKRDLRRIPWGFSLAGLVCLVTIEIGVEAWYRVHETKMSSRLRWTVQWPESVPGFREIPIDEQIKNALRFDEGRQGAWPISDESVPSPSTPRGAAPERPSIVQCTLFLFRWQPGTTTILRARAHRPDICLPSAGWRQTTDHGVRDYPIAENLALPFRHFTFIRSFPGQRDLFAEAFFCMHEDSVRTDQASGAHFDPNSSRPTTWSFPDRYRVVRQGLRNPGQQVMQMIFIAPNEVGGAAAEARFAKLVRDLAVAEGGQR